MAQATVYADDPVGVARRWQAAGAQRLHVVDLDGAVSGTGVNTDVIARICRALDIPVQLGGGCATWRRLSGCSRSACSGPSWARWRIGSRRSWPRRANAFRVGLRSALMPGTARSPCRLDSSHRTGRHRAGRAVPNHGRRRDCLYRYCPGRHRAGGDIDATRTLARTLEIPVIASGGVASLRDVELLLAGEADGIRGLIIGRALYTGAVDLAEAIRLGRRSAGSQKSKGKGQS